jgi:hypothetical protein
LSFWNTKCFLTPQFPTPPKYRDVVAVYRGVSPYNDSTGEGACASQGSLKPPALAAVKPGSVYPPFFLSPQKCDWRRSHVFLYTSFLRDTTSSCQSRLSHPYRWSGNMSETKRSDDVEAQIPGTPTRSSFRPLVGTPTRSSFRTLLRTPLGTPLGTPLRLKFSQSPAPKARVDTEYNVSTGRKFAYLSVYFLCNIALTIYNKAVLGKVRTVFSYSGPPNKCMISV